MVRNSANKQTSKSESESTRSVSPLDKQDLDQEETSSVDSGLKGSFSQHVSSMRGNGGQDIGLSKSRTEFAKGLQSTYGNSYTRQVVSSASDSNGPTIQTKLEVGASNDHYEMEADRIAEKIVGRTLPSNEGETSVTNGASNVQRARPTPEEREALAAKARRENKRKEMGYGSGSEPITQSLAESGATSSPRASDEGQAPPDVEALARSHPKPATAEEGIYVEANQPGPKPPERSNRPGPMPPQRPGQPNYEIPYQWQNR